MLSLKAKWLVECMHSTNHLAFNDSISSVLLLFIIEV